MEDERSYKRLFQNAFWRLLSFSVPFIVDTAIGSLIFVALIWFAWLLGLGRAVGVKQEQLDTIELAHFWISYGVFVGVGLSFLLRIVKMIFKGD